MRKNLRKPHTNKSLAKGNDGSPSKLTVTDLYVNPKPGCSKDPDNVLLIPDKDASNNVEVAREQFVKPKTVELPTKKSGRPTKKLGRPRKCSVQIERNKPTKKRGRPRKVPAEASKGVGPSENVIERRKSLRSSGITERTPGHNISLPKSSEATPSRCRYKLRNSFCPGVDMASRNMGQHNQGDKDPFDQLCEQKPLRTYQNTRRLKTLNDPPMRILEFQDCRNKENIIKWLEDSQNLFDRFTQTQTDVVGSNLQDDFLDDDNVMAFEMPSASQVGPKVVPKPLAAVKVGKRNRSRSISKFRARSLNVHIKKNNQGSSSKRHSLAGDTPSLEDYHIEEVVSCKEFPVCQENDVKALLHLMEDDCLDSLENETLPHENNERDTHNVTGWTRIEDIKKSITKKQPKQLKIKVNKSNGAAKRTALGRCISVDNNVLETFFEKNMMKETKEGGSKEEREVEVQKKGLIQRVIDSWQGLKENLEVIAKNGNNKETENNSELQRVLIEMGEFMKKLRNTTFVNAMVQTSSPELASCFTQTAIISQTNSEVQTDEDCIALKACEDLNSVDAETQTGLNPEREILLANAQAQTEPHCISQNSVYIQTESHNIIQSSVQVQTDSDEVVQCSGKNKTDNLRISQSIVQGQRLSQTCPQIVPHTSSVQDHCKTSATPNNVPQSNASSQSILFNTNPRDQPAGQVPCEGLSQSFDAFVFETEDFLRVHEVSRSQNPKLAVQQVSQVVMESQKEVSSNESNLVVSGPTNELRRENSGLKRPLSPQPVVGASNKRPCHRFLRDDLSVSIVSETDSSPMVVPPIDTRFQMSSDDSNEYDIRLNELMTKYDSTVKNEGAEPVVKLPELSRTQELINECDTIIHNMTKCKRTMEKSTHKDCASDAFQICKPSTSHQQSNVEKEQYIINSSNVNLVEDIRALHEECLGIKTCSTISDIVPDSESPGVMPRFRRSLFTTKPDTVVKNKAKIPNCDTTIITKDDDKDEDLWQNVQRLSHEKDEADITLTESNIDKILGEINGQGSGQASLPCQQAMVEQITSDAPPTPKRLKILQDIVTPSCSRRSGSVRLVDDSDGSLTDCDVIETTPQKKKPNALPDLARENYNSMLDVTLPPPLEFQDFVDTTMDCEQEPFGGFMDVSKNQKVSSQLGNDILELTAKYMDVENTPSTSRPKAKITSTPLTQRGCSERYPTFSPIPRKTATSLELARESKLTTLAFVPGSQVQNIYANVNTPKQLSILQYVSRSHGSKSSPTTSQSSELKRRVSKKPYSQLRSPSLGELCSKPCVACSRLSREQNEAISSLTDRKLATYSPSFTSKVTHLVVSVNENQELQDYTAKYVMAVSRGIWVLSFQWVQKCLEANRIVSEEPYEVLDRSGLPGPKTSRLTRATNPLLKRYKIHLVGTFLSASKEDLRNIVLNLGGEIVEFASELQQLREQFICVIIAETKSTDDFDLYEDLLEKYGVLSVDIEWLTRSVSKYQVISFRPYALCGDEFMGDLGYPPELTEEITLTSTQNM